MKQIKILDKCTDTIDIDPDRMVSISNINISKASCHFEGKAFYLNGAYEWIVGTHNDITYLIPLRKC